MAHQNQSVIRSTPRRSVHKRQRGSLQRISNLKEVRNDTGDWADTGREFQKVGAATEKARYAGGIEHCYWSNYSISTAVCCRRMLGLCDCSRPPYTGTVSSQNSSDGILMLRFGAAEDRLLKVIKSRQCAATSVPAANPTPLWRWSASSWIRTALQRR